MKEYFEKWCCLIIFFNKKDERNTTAGVLENEYQNNKHIIQIANAIPCTKHVYHSKFAGLGDSIEGKVSQFEIDDNNKVLQRLKAFELAFSMGFRKVILIGNDMPGIEVKHLEEAFNSLKIIEFCIGPKKFGGFYLLGMNYFETSIFYQMQIDSPTVIKNFIRDIGKIKKALYKLPVLTPSPVIPEIIGEQTLL